MKNLSFWKKAILSAACVGLVVPQQLMAVPPVAPKVVQASEVAVDVMLNAEGAFTGRVINDQGNAVDGAEVVFRQGEEVVAKTVANSEGQFTLAGLKSGLYVADAAQGQAAFRVWEASMAPPAARSEGVLVAGKQVLRGQPMGGDLVTIALVTGVAVTTGFAISNNSKIDDLEDKIDELSNTP